MSDEIATLERSLKDLPSIGTMVKDRGYRQVWRVEVGGRAYFLKFYPRSGSRLKRLVRGSPALREFTSLIALQKAAIPSPRAVAVLSGFRIQQKLGDAVILQAIEPSIQLDRHLSDLEFRGQPLENHRALAAQIIQLVHQLAAAKLGHSDLHLGNFLLSSGKVYLLDGYAVRRNGLKLKDLLLLGHSARRYATITDFLRGWRMLTTSGSMPAVNPAGRRLFRKFLERVTRDNQYFGRLRQNGWRGHFLKQIKFPRPWTAASQLQFTREQWEQAWMDLRSRIDADQLTIIKRSGSGDVLSGEIVMDGRPIPVIVKRPRRKFWYRYLNSIGRPSRARRTWIKAWKLYIRGIAAEFPLLLMERRTFGYVTDAIIVFESMQGQILSKMDLDALEPSARDMLFRRLGRSLRKLEQLGFAHFDAKSSNWIIRLDEKTGTMPILIDVDGVRHYSWRGEGIDRLLRSMREHPQYTPADSLALCQGYAPWSPVQQEAAPDSTPAETC